MIRINKNDSSLEFITPENLLKFLNEYQRGNVSLDDCKKIIANYEKSDAKFDFKLTLNGLSAFMMDQLIMNPIHSNTIYQDLNLPLQNYFISSSHNT